MLSRHAEERRLTTYQKRYRPITIGRFPLMAELRRIRIQRGLCLIDLAGQVGYHHATIGKWERGDDYPSVAALDDWCTALGLKLNLTVDESDGDHP